ncbi:hypothetical protein COOONC_03187 [Cooperia oncophora]
MIIVAHYLSLGLRSGGTSDSSGSSTVGGATSGASPVLTGCPRPQSLPASNTHQQNRKSTKDVEENNNIRGVALSPDHDAASHHSDSSKSQGSQRLKRTESSISSESQKSTGSGSGRGSVNMSQGRDNVAHTAFEKRTKQPTPPKKEPKKKVMTEREVMDVAAGLRALKIGAVTKEIEDWIACGFADDNLAESIGSALCQHAIEGGGGRAVAKLCGALRDSSSAFALYRGLLLSVSQYFECRDRLRADHFRMWISFLAFVADLYANIGGGKDGELVNFVFQVFDYLLRAPILETLKIEERSCMLQLESLISALLSVGYDLERECPDQLSLLKDLIRDAFIDVSEPWARKMILLLLELGASGWKLPAEANEYYFQQTTN